MCYIKKVNTTKNILHDGMPITKKKKKKKKCNCNIANLQNLLLSSYIICKVKEDGLVTFG